MKSIIEIFTFTFVYIRNSPDRGPLFFGVQKRYINLKELKGRGNTGAGEYRIVLIASKPFSRGPFKRPSKLNLTSERLMSGDKFVKLN